MSDSEWTTIRRTSVLPSNALPSRAPMRIPSNRSMGGEPPLPKITSTAPLRAFGGAATGGAATAAAAAEFQPFSRSSVPPASTANRTILTPDMFPALPTTNTLTTTIPRATPISFAAMARKGHDKSEADIARAKLELEAEREHQQREAHEAQSILALRSFGVRASRFIEPEDDEPEYVDNHEAYVGKAYESKGYDSRRYEEHQEQYEGNQEQNQEDHYFD